METQLHPQEQNPTPSAKWKATPDLRGVGIQEVLGTLGERIGNRSNNEMHLWGVIKQFLSFIQLKCTVVLDL